MALLVRMNSRGKQERTLSASVVARAFVRKRGKEEKKRWSERTRERERDKDHGQNMKVQQQQKAIGNTRCVECKKWVSWLPEPMTPLVWYRRAVLFNA